MSGEDHQNDARYFFGLLGSMRSNYFRATRRGMQHVVHSRADRRDDKDTHQSADGVNHYHIMILRTSYSLKIDTAPPYSRNHKNAYHYERQQCCAGKRYGNGKTHERYQSKRGEGK